MESSNYYEMLLFTNMMLTHHGKRETLKQFQFNISYKY